MKLKYPEWTIVDWEGNPDLGYKCWRKSFPGGHVSIGIGDWKSIVFSYGPNSHNSMTSTRWSLNGVMSEQEAMEMVDKNNGKYKPNL